MEVSVQDASVRLGVSPRRVRALLADGQLVGRKLGARWVVDAAALPRRSSARGGRPMSARMAWAFLLGAEVEWLNAQERYRIRQRRKELVGAEDPVRVLHSWVRHRAERFLMHAPSLDDVVGDSRAVVSGVSDRRSFMNANQAEVYVHRDNFEAFTLDHLAVNSSRPNLIVHVSAIQVPDPVPLLLVAADLAGQPDPRSVEQAHALIKKALN